MSAPAPASASAPVTRSKRKASQALALQALPALPALPASPTVPSAPKKNKTGAPAKASAKAKAKASAKAKAQELEKELMKGVEEGWKLSTAMPPSLKKALGEKKKLVPIDEKVLVSFFTDYFGTIYGNIDYYIGIVRKKGFQDLILSEGGFDRVFESKSDYTIKNNIAIYNRLFTQFKSFRDPSNTECGRLNGGIKLKLNLLISYMGEAVLILASGKNDDELKKLYSKIVVVLELAVEPKVFLHFMNGVNKKTYEEIYERSQEYLGIYETYQENNGKGYDPGIRKFVVNYVRRAVLYMRKYDKTYDFGYELPYNYSHELSKALKFPLPLNGVYQFGPGPQYYEVSKMDWDYIPNVLLEPGCCDTDYKHLNVKPSDWHNPPTKLWLDTAVALFNNKKWWEIKKEEIETVTANIKQDEYRHDMNYRRLLLVGIPDKDQYNNTLNAVWNAEYPQYTNLFKKPRKGKTGGILKAKPKAIAKPKPKVAKPKPKAVSKPKPKVAKPKPKSVAKPKPKAVAKPKPKVTKPKAVAKPKAKKQ